MIRPDEEGGVVRTCLMLAHIYKCSPLDFFDLTFDQLFDIAGETQRMLRSLKRQQQDMD